MIGLYHLNGKEIFSCGDKKYEVKWENSRYKVTELAERFDGLFVSETGNVMYFDNFRDIQDHFGGLEKC